MKCPNCNTESEGKYCRNCGTPINSQKSINIPSPSSSTWYTKTWVIILFLIFLWPVGLFLMWKHKKSWKKITKILVTIFILIIALHSCSSNGNTVVSDEDKTITSLTAEYSGETEAGTLIDDDNRDITVIAHYDDGTESKVFDWTIKNPSELIAEKSSIYTIEYNGVTTELDIQCSTMSEDTYKSMCDSISYEDLARTPDDYTGKLIKFTGEIIQVQGSGTDAAYRIDVTENEYGFWEDTVYVTFDLSNSGSRFLEEDIVTFYGEYDGLYTYTSIFGEEITIPSVNATYIDLNK